MESGPKLKLGMWLKHALTRPRAVFRALRRLGLKVTLQLIGIRLGSESTIYRLNIPCWQHPVYVRGGGSSDTTVLYELLVTDEYQRAEGIKPPRTIVDGGANIGLTGVYFLNRYPSARIISVEPFEATFRMCQKNLAPYGERATALHGAIWSSPGRVAVNGNGWDMNNRVSASSDGQAGTVEAFTMDSLVKASGGFVDLFKLDVEGSEREIFGPGSAAWLPNIANIIVELHGKACEDRFFEALAPYHYEMANRELVYACLNLRSRSAEGATTGTGSAATPAR